MIALRSNSSVRVQHQTQPVKLFVSNPNRGVHVPERQSYSTAHPAHVQPAKRAAPIPAALQEGHPCIPTSILASPGLWALALRRTSSVPWPTLEITLHVPQHLMATPTVPEGDEPSLQAAPEGCNMDLWWDAIWKEYNSFLTIVKSEQFGE
jgi:hypothetical protein